jgi:hypothetical protein
MYCSFGNFTEFVYSMGLSNVVDPGPPALSHCSMLCPPRLSTTTLLPISSTAFSSLIPISTSAAGTTSISYYTEMGTSTLSSASSTSTTSTITTTPSSGMQVSSNQSGISPKGWQSWNSGAKAGCIVGTIIIFLAVLVLAIIFITQRKRRKHTLSSATDDRLYGSLPGIQVEVIAAGEPKTSLDSAGIRWPEGVVLTGDAKEIHEWTTDYDRDYRGRMSLGVARREKECEYRVENSVRPSASKELPRPRS